mgnify:CR=1 FL=1
MNLKELFKTSSFDLSIGNFIFSIFLAYVLSYLLSIVYIKHAKSFSNHQSLSRIFPLLSITVTIVIAVVKSSLALSLGLVGALSIVRFRTPIKEPEELTFLFLSIAIGLACGADQFLPAIIGFILACVGINLNDKLRRTQSSKNYLRLSIQGINVEDISELIKITSTNSKKIDFNSLIIEDNKTNNKTSIILSILQNSFNDTDSMVKGLSKRFPTANIAILDMNNI